MHPWRQHTKPHPFRAAPHIDTLRGAIDVTVFIITIKSVLFESILQSTNVGIDFDGIVKCSLMKHEISTFLCLSTFYTWKTGNETKTAP